jgi:hypothetical protein
MHTQWWGTVDGIKKEKKAFGPNDENGTNSTLGWPTHTPG